jgi:hypothetical protein
MVYDVVICGDPKDFQQVIYIIQVVATSLITIQNTFLLSE